MTDLLLIVPHPDDEVFGAGALLARTAATGGRTAVLTLTRGAAGRTLGLASREELPTVREAELRESLTTLGVDDVTIADYQDYVPDDDRGLPPHAGLDAVPEEELLELLVLGRHRLRDGRGALPRCLQTLPHEAYRPTDQPAGGQDRRALRQILAAGLANRFADRDIVRERIEDSGRHVVHENARTLEAARVMREGDAVRLGELMDESHRSLRDDFEVSSEALDTMVEVAREHAACLGARMTGAGFGGCAVALVERGAAGHFARSVAQSYRERTGLEPKVYVTGATAGAAVVGARRTESVG